MATVVTNLGSLHPAEFNPCLRLDQVVIQQRKEQKRKRKKGNQQGAFFRTPYSEYESKYKEVPTLESLLAIAKSGKPL